MYNNLMKGMNTMPVNSFDSYPLTWKPEKEKLKPPYYKSLADVYKRQENDHRLKRVILTQKAKEAHAYSFQIFDELEKKMLKGFTEDEANLFYLFLMRAADNIRVDYLSEIKRG